MCMFDINIHTCSKFLYMQYTHAHTYTRTHAHTRCLQQRTPLSPAVSASSYDWLFWSDADALFVNQSIPLEQYLDPRAHVIFPAGPPWSKKYRGFINSGHFFIRNSEWTVRFLKETWLLKSSPCGPGTNTSALLLNGWWDVCLPSGICCEMGEQSAFMILLDRQPEWVPHIKYVGFRYVILCACVFYV